MSINPDRTAPYSEDLRWRIIWQREGLGMGVVNVAANLGVDPSTVSRIVQLFRGIGDVCKRPYPKNARPDKKLSSPVQLTILHAVLRHPKMYLDEIQKEVCVLTGVHLSISSVCKFLQSSNFTRQKMTLIAQQRDHELREQFTIDASLYKPYMCVFIDETGSDNRDALRRYGYSVRGKPPKSCQLLVRGERLSAIAAMTCKGIQALKMVHDSVDGDIFVDFVQRDLLPILLPFNGVNSNSIVILDNCSIHHVAEVESMITEVGALVHFLPPYSPDLNPIEHCFSKVKACLKNGCTVNGDDGDSESAVLAAFTSVTPNDCDNWIKETGVYGA